VQRRRNSSGQTLVGCSGLLVGFVLLAVGLLAVSMYHLAFCMNASSHARFASILESAANYGVNNSEVMGVRVSNFNVNQEIPDVVHKMCEHAKLPVTSTDVTVGAQFMDVAGQVSGLPVLVGGNFGNVRCMGSAAIGVSAPPAVLSFHMNKDAPGALVIPVYGHGEIAAGEIGPACNGIPWWHYYYRLSLKGDPIFLN
jgi:hypothetical protein